MALFVLSVIGCAIVFIFFLVVVRTLGSIVNHLTKIEYWVTQELEFKKEQEEIRRALEADEAEQAKRKEESEKKSTSLLGIPPVSGGSKK